jgi:nitroimidazol reductase NimA-like FMN-containing flavoprotein (pyridoxamine 5'-phosphate oxidase superfamily)
MFGDLNVAQMEELLHSNILGRIGCHAGNTTYIVPISYAYMDKTIYCHSRPGTKIDMMRQNPEVCFEVDKLTDMANWKSVIAWGTFQELDDKDERKRALEFLVNRVLPMVSSETTHLSSSWPFPPDDLNEIKGIVFKILIKKMTGRYERFEKGYETTLK